MRRTDLCAASPASSTAAGVTGPSLCLRRPLVRGAGARRSLDREHGGERALARDRAGGGGRAGVRAGVRATDIGLGASDLPEPRPRVVQAVTRFGRPGAREVTALTRAADGVPDPPAGRISRAPLVPDRSEAHETEADTSAAVASAPHDTSSVGPSPGPPLSEFLPRRIRGRSAPQPARVEPESEPDVEPEPEPHPGPEPPPQQSRTSSRAPSTVSRRATSEPPSRCRSRASCRWPDRSPRVP